MKTFVQLILALGLAVFLGVISLAAGVRLFIGDVIGVQGRSIIGGSVEFQDYALDWQRRSLQLNRVCLSKEGKVALLCADTLLLQVSGDFMPSLGSTSLFPSVSMIDKVEANKVTVAYDIDDEGKDVYWLKAKVAVLAADAMRDRMNAASKAGNSPLLFQIGELKISDITVNAISRDAPSLSKSFPCENISLSGVGFVEKGITTPEIADQVMQKIIGVVRMEVARRIVVKEVETVRTSTSGKASRKQAARTKEDDVQDKGAGKDIKELWKKTKSLFE